MAITVYATSAPDWTNYGTPVTRSFETPAAASERVLVVLIATRFTSQTTGITYAGQSLTMAARADDGGNRVTAEVWYLINPPVGTANIVATFTSAKRVHMAVVLFAGANQTAANLIGDVDQSDTGNGTTPSITLTSASGEVCLDVLAVLADTDHTVTVGSGQSQLSQARAESGGPAVRGATSNQGGAGSVVLDWTIGTGGSFYAHAAVAFKPSAGGGGGADTTAPAAATVTAFPVAAGSAVDYFIALPPDADASLNWSLRRAADAYPATDRSDGTQIGSGAAPPGSLIEVNDTGRTNGDPDYVRAFVQDAAGNWNDGTGNAATYCYPGTRATLVQRYKSDFLTTVADGTTETGPNPIIVMQLASTMGKDDTAHLIAVVGNTPKLTENEPPTGSTRTYDSRADPGVFMVEHPAASGDYIGWDEDGMPWGTYGGRKVAIRTQEAGTTRYLSLRVYQPATVAS